MKLLPHCGWPLPNKLKLSTRRTRRNSETQGRWVRFSAASNAFWFSVP